MDPLEAAMEADVELDGEAVRRHETINRKDRGRKGARIAEGGMQIPQDDGGSDPNESSPLLTPGCEEGLPGYADEQNAGGSQWHGMKEFAGLSWYRQPNIIWVLVPFFLMACAFGGVITPKINLILELICKRYMSEQRLLDPNFTMTPVDFQGGKNDQCRIAPVQEQVSTFTLWSSFLAGTLSALTSPHLGALSDRYGRKPVLVLTSVGTIAGEVITLFAAIYPETFPVNLLLVGYAIDGLMGSFIVAMAIANSYAADCTPPARRNVTFGYFHGALFSGIALGPIIAGYIVKKTNQIAIVFWVLLAVHIFFIFFVSLFVPESLSKKRQLEARQRHREDFARRRFAPERPRWMKNLHSLNFLAPLKVLWPTGPGSSSALRRNIVLLAAVDTIVFGVAMGSMTVIVIYTNYMFGWGSFESGRFMTIVNTCRVFCLVIMLPALTRYFRAHPNEATERKHTGSDTFDLAIIRVSVFFDTLGYIGYTLSSTGGMMIASGAVAALGGIGAPTLQSSLTKHVAPEKTGQLLGASGLLHALARVVAPMIFNGIYTETVATYPQTVFVCLASTFGVAFFLTCFLRINVYFDENKAAQAED